MYRRTPAEIFRDAEAKVERARQRQATHLNIGEKRRSLTQLPSLAGLTFLRSVSIISTGITDLTPLQQLPSLESVDVSNTPVWDLSPLAKISNIKYLNLAFSSVTDLRPLSALKRLERLNLDGTRVTDLTAVEQFASLSRLELSGCPISDISPVANLPQLTFLDISYCTAEVDLSPLRAAKNLKTLYMYGSRVKSFDALYGAKSLTRLLCSRTQINSLAPVAGLPLESLDIESTNVTDLAPLANVKSLRHLDISGTKISDISPLKHLTKLDRLNLDNSLVSDLSPLANLRSLAFSEYWLALTFTGCPINDQELVRLGRARGRSRLLDILNYLRERQNLPPFTSEKESVGDQAGLGEQISPLSNVPSPFLFELSNTGTIVLTSSPANWPVFPTASSQQDHAHRLDVCRTLAEDLAEEVSSQRYQVRGEYRDGLQRYAHRLPTKPGDGNILLADAEARTLRNLFAAESDQLSIPFASKLKTFLEQHIGLRVFYPEIAKFYRDVQTGRMQIPLPLDAVEGFVRGVQENTPTVFDPSVRDIVEGSADETQQQFDRLEAPPPSSASPIVVPPKDPLGDIDPKVTSDFTFAGAANGIWRAFLEGEKINRAVDAWRKAGETLKPHIADILSWLQHFVSTGGGPPPSMGV